jgi:alpha/beta superfamily hydrolase
MTWVGSTGTWVGVAAAEVVGEGARVVIAGAAMTEVASAAVLQPARSQTDNSNKKRDNFVIGRLFKGMDE